MLDQGLHYSKNLAFYVLLPFFYFYLFCSSDLRNTTAPQDDVIEKKAIQPIWNWMEKKCCCVFQDFVDLKEYSKSVKVRLAEVTVKHD